MEVFTMMKDENKKTLMLTGAAAVGYVAVKVVGRAVSGVTKYIAFNEMMKRCNIERDDGILFGCIDINTDECEKCDEDCEYCHESATEFAEKEGSKEEKPINIDESDASEFIKENKTETDEKGSDSDKAFREKARDFFNSEDTDNITKSKIEKGSGEEELRTSESNKQTKSTRTKKERK